MPRGYTGKCIVGCTVYKFIRTWSERGAGLHKIYWRTGPRYSAHTGGVSGLKGADKSYDSNGRRRGIRPTLS